MTSPDAWSEDRLAQARRALVLGRELCACGGYYHALWPSLRVAGITDSLPFEEPVLASLMSPFIRDGARVMIAGAADPGFLCVMGRIYGARRPRFTVMDRCGAGLELVREFAEAKRHALQIRKLDLLELDESEQYDQIVMHYILDFVPPQFRKRFLANLARALTKGGVLVSCGMTAAKIAGARDRELENVFLGYGLETLRNSPLAEDTHAAEFEHMLQGYAAAWGTRRLHKVTAEEQRALLTGAGFELISETVVPRPRRSAGGATIVDTRTIIVAMKP